MEATDIVLKKERQIALLTIDHKPVNALNLKTMQELENIIGVLEDDKGIRVLVITGAGGKCFSAGYDLNDGANADAISPLGQLLYRRIDRYPKPVIAAINGHAVGGGCELALACQFRIMTTDPKARIGLPELNLGLIPAWGGTQRLSRLVGMSKAMDMILFGKKIAASTAYEIGLVNSLAEPDQLMQRTLEFAQKLSELPPIAVSYVLKAVSTGIYEGVDRGLEVEDEGGAVVRNCADFKEGQEAFVQKRKPVFRGL